MLNRTLLVINLLAAGSCILLAVKFVILPIYAEIRYKNQFKEYVFQCDNSMREHMIAKNKFLLNPNTENERILDSADVGLLTCHEYDLLRKKMLNLGLTNDNLSQYGLEAIEQGAADVREIVRIHEFRY
jgi:3-isopropylmalate dehydratase small subunit